jgi:hypothetical protein
MQHHHNARTYTVAEFGFSLGQQLLQVSLTKKEKDKIGVNSTRQFQPR